MKFVAQTTVPTVTLNNGVEMPRLGYGMWQVADESAVHAAVAAGYRSIDTAAVYGNEREAGRAIAQSDIAREEFFITTKLWNTEHGFDSALRAFEESRRKLALDVVDLYLIHWPQPAFDRYVETWRALERLYAEGAVRAIGVSNFVPDHLQHLLEQCEVAPALNQIELHPFFVQRELRAFHDRHGIATEAWSPLGRGTDLLARQVVVDVATRHGRTPAQVVLRWHLQQGNVVIPKSSTPQRIAENFDVFGFELTPDDMHAIDELDEGRRIGPDPLTFS